MPEKLPRLTWLLNLKGSLLKTKRNVVESKLCPKNNLLRDYLFQLFILQSLHNIKVPQSPNLPNFFTPVDLVDLGVEICGLKFENPFGLASAPPTTTSAMMRRGYEAGWGFTVSKTFVLDKVCTICCMVIKLHQFNSLLTVIVVYIIKFEEINVFPFRRVKQ